MARTTTIDSFPPPLRDAFSTISAEGTFQRTFPSAEEAEIFRLRLYNFNRFLLRNRITNLKFTIRLVGATLTATGVAGAIAAPAAKKGRTSSTQLADQSPEEVDMGELERILSSGLEDSNH